MGLSIHRTACSADLSHCIESSPKAIVTISGADRNVSRELPDHTRKKLLGNSMHVNMLKHIMYSLKDWFVLDIGQEENHV